MPDEYPWYKIVEGEELEQGDVLRRCPIIVPIVDYGQEISADILEFDVIVMTQSCDLINPKVADVILCPHWDLNEVAKIDNSLANKNAHQEILKGRRHRYTMLAASNTPEVPMGVRIVDFGRIFSLPKLFVSRFAASLGKRIRLCPPYREHLSQAFARFFMRVGLPQNIELPK